MSVNLTKGDSVNLTKAAPALAKVSVGAGWDPKEGGPTMDADLCCFLLADNGQVRSSGDFVFFNNKNAADGAVVHQGDNLTGEGEGDDEVINVDLSSLPDDVKTVLFAVNIYNAKAKGQSLADIDNAHVRIVNEDNGEEMSIFKITEATGETMSFGSLVRGAEGWEFQAINESSNDDLGAFAKAYGI